MKYRLLHQMEMEAGIKAQPKNTGIPSERVHLSTSTGFSEAIATLPPAFKLSLVK